ncbi:MAG: cation:proton antiporter [Gloeomargarita sp. SKYBB_i_bin120]|nr:cation:proton antiporter [Gloeomargarita sp. SKYG98]MCS7291878.1 cation:proton antiporter [Gloeomargarita sp. SKYB120]MDW8177438.1 cation:proton antiporter [Gloeomargarita sp. SKYBB_i_bin120]
MQADGRLIVDLVVVLAAALGGGTLAALLKQPPLLGYIVAGVLVGPTGFGGIREVVQVETLAQFGVTLLLFSLGVKFSFARLRQVGVFALGGGLLQMGLTMALTAYGVAVSGWLSPTAGVVLGAILALSSTAVALKSLAEIGQTDSLAGKAMLGILIVQDLAVGLILAVLPALAVTWEEIGTALGVALLKLLLFSLGAVALGRWGVPRFLRFLAQRESRELFLLGVVCLCVGVALLTERLGLSSEMGAFVAGLMIAEVDYADQTLDYVEPLRDVFGALFFASIGMLIDPRFILAHAPLIAGLVLLVMGGKFLIAAPVTRLFGYSWPMAVLVGCGLSQIGEFSFILATAAQELGLISRSVYLLVVGTTAITLLVSPALLPWAARLWERWDPTPQPPATTGESQWRDHFVICGYGQIGQDVAQILAAHRCPLLVLDQSERAIAQARQREFPYLWGDATAWAILQRANLPCARAMVITLPDLASIRLCLQRVLQLAPQLPVLVCAPRKEHIELLYRLGASKVIHPDFEASLGLCSHLLTELGVPPHQIQAELAAIRNHHYQDLSAGQPVCLLPMHPPPPVTVEVTP